jgi:hypothetical protein
MQDSTARANKAGDQVRRAGLFGIVRLFCLAYAACVIFQDVQECLWRAYLIPGVGDLEITFNLSGPFDHGFVPVHDVKAGGVMAANGVKAGDQVRFDRPFDFVRRLAAGEHIGFTLKRANQVSHHVVVAPPVRPERDWAGLVYDVATSIAALFGAFIIWRSRRDATTLLLGLALLTYGLATAFPQFWESDARIFPFAFVPGMVNYAAVPVLFYAFALRFYRDQVGPVRAWETAAFWIYAAIETSINGAWIASYLTASSFPILGDSDLLQSGVLFLGFAVCLGYLFLGWRRSSPSSQQRYALVLMAAAAIFVAQLFDSFWTTDRFEAIKLIHYATNTVLAGIVAPALLTYAILKRKVFDLGFAVNRTLVYGAVSAILLAAFGLIEWAVDHFLPIEGRERSALVDAAIAVGVFLTFHRVRDMVEHVIERLFFHRWQEAEARLRRFVTEAAFVTESSALAEGFALALGRYAEGAEAAVYLETSEGYEQVAGRVEAAGRTLNANLPAILSARADLKSVEAHDDTLAGCLIAPMVNRNEVTGLAIIGPKPSGLGYRPDEIELMGWAARQVGLDLHALRIEQLERERADLKSANAQLARLLRPAEISPRPSPA